MDISTFVGILLGVGGIFVGNLIEGGSAGALLQSTAFLIVFGGTFGAVLVGNRWIDIKTGFQLLKTSFRADNDEEKSLIAKEITEAARIARKETLLALEQRLPTFKSEYFKVVLRYVIDNVDAKSLRDVFEAEIESEEDRLLSGAKIWSDAGGYAPTIGIIGAVLGLIHVMSHLSDTSQLGKGIAVAFVATIYGVGSANLFFLPIANKIRKKIYALSDTKRLCLEGALAIHTGMNPFLVDEKMRAMSDSHRRTIEEVL